MTSVIIHLLLYLHDCTVIWKVYFVHVHLIIFINRNIQFLTSLRKPTCYNFFSFKPQPLDMLCPVMLCHLSSSQNKDQYHITIMPLREEPGRKD